MNRVSIPALLAATAVTAVAPNAQAQTHRFHRDQVLGSSMDMVAVGGRVAAHAALEAALAEIDRLDAVLSGWRSDSELSRLNRRAAAVVSADLYSVLAEAETWRSRTDGAFDGRLGKVEAVWRAAEDAGQAPDPARLQRAASVATTRPLRFDAVSRRVERPAGAVLALDGLAKGYVIDAALAAARRAAPDLDGVMIDIGGDLAVWGQGPSGDWAIGAIDPAHPADNAPAAAVLLISSGAVATSGGGPRDRDIGGRTFGVGLEPSSGRAADAVCMATVVAGCALDADALSTALSVLPAKAGLALIARTPGAEALIQTRDGARLASPGWTRLAQATPQPARGAAPAANAGAPWPAGFQVAIDYELLRPTSGPVYGAYVSLWVTDANNLPVRQLVLLGSDLNYVDQNFIWWRRFGRSAPDMVDAVSRPTRKAGRYRAVWDGRDQAGRPLGQGRYTIHIEVSREHGQHNYQSIPVTLGAAPTTGTAAAGDEAGVTRLRYGKTP